MVKAASVITEKKLSFEEHLEAADAAEHNSNVANLAAASRYCDQFLEDLEDAKKQAEALKVSIRDYANGGKAKYEKTKKLYHDARSLQVKGPTI